MCFSRGISSDQQHIYSTLDFSQKVEKGTMKDQASIIKVITTEFSRRFKFVNLSNLDLTIPLSRDIIEADNQMLTMGVLNDKILEVVK